MEVRDEREGVDERPPHPLICRSPPTVFTQLLAKCNAVLNTLNSCFSDFPFIITFFLLGRIFFPFFWLNWAYWFWIRSHCAIVARFNQLVYTLCWWKWPCWHWGWGFTERIVLHWNVILRQRRIWSQRSAGCSSAPLTWTWRPIEDFFRRSLFWKSNTPLDAMRS